MKNIFCGLFATLSILSYSQVSDSVFVPEHPYFEGLEAQLWKNPVQQNKTLLKDYTAVTLDFSSRNLQVKRTQTAENTNDIGFQTKGYYHFSKNLKLFGSFDYDFIQEKNLGFTLYSGRSDEDFVMNPNYLFVPKASNWEIQKYRIKGGATYDFSNFTVGALVDYLNQSSFRKTDPRPEIKTADYTGKLFAGFTFGKHQLSAFAGYGRKTDNNDVMAVNELVNTPSNPENFIRFSNGYGRIVNFPSYFEFLYSTVLRNMGGGYRFQNEKLHFNLNYAYSKTMENIYTRSAYNQVYIDQDLEYMKYREIFHEVFGSLVYHSENAKILSDFGAKILTGDNYNIVEQGQNFRKTWDHYFANFTYLKQGISGKYYGLKLKSEVNDFRAQDLLGVSDKKVQTLDLGLQFQSELYKNNNQNLNAAIGVNHYFPLQADLAFTQVSSSSTFYDRVILPDHYYDSTSKTGVSAEISFSDRFMKNTSWKIFSKFGAVFAHQSDEVPNQYYRNPNVYFQTGITFFY